MTKALSYLGEVLELAISVDNGLGWIAGPDMSDRARIFAEKHQIFGAQHPPSNKKSLERLHVWKTMTEFMSLDTVWISKPQTDRPWGFNAPYAVIGSAYPQVTIPSVRRQSSQFPPLIFDDEDYETEDRSSEGWPSHGRPSFPKASLVPNALKPAQKEWLLENYWAQDAFLTSWSLAVMDNTATFSNVRTLNIAFISSKHLDTLQRPDLWKALVSVQSLCLMVSPDWLDIAKAEDQSVETWELLPSHVAHKLYKFLESCIRETSNIGTLKIGYVGGGERASGMFARNKNVLPAPIIDFGQQRSDVAHVDNVMTLPYVQNLTLCNCWMTPDTLKEFVGKMKLHRLSSLVLDSVSLTAQPPRDPPPTYPSMYPRAFWGKQGQRRFHTTDGSLQDERPGPRNGPIAPATLDNVRWFLFDEGMSTTLFDGPWDPEDTDDEWRHRSPPFGTWADVVNTITPGENLVRKRYTHGITYKVPASRFNGSLQRIEFISCGYIRLPKLTAFVQTSLGGISDCSIFKLRGRCTELAEVMMSRGQDVFLGQIVPSIRWEEVCFLRGAFNLHDGWHPEDMSKYNTREDGQPLGGSGRFSGIVKRVQVPRAT